MIYERGLIKLLLELNTQRALPNNSLYSFEGKACRV